MITKKTNIKRLLHVGLLFLLVAMLLTTATQNSTAAQETDLTAYTNAGIDWQQAAGEEIILGGLEHPWIEALTPLLPQFTELTGIKVTPQIASETEYVTKMPVTLGGGSATPDIFMVWAMGQAVAAKWLEPLDMYYADPKLTDLAWYDEADIFNSARQFPVWPTDKRRYTATITAEAQTLFLRQDLMEEKGLGAPKTFDDLLALAEALKTDEMAGIAMRAKPTGDAVAWPAAGFVFSYGGQIIDENGKAVFDSPEAVAAIEMYAKLLGENGPQGVGTYHWYEALNDFMQGKVAISGDSSNFAADIENPEKSTVAGKTLYGAFPQQGSLPSKPNLWHWMIGMNAASEHKTAAWLFMQWATSKPTSIQLGRNGAAPARISTWEDADFKARFGEQAAEAALANLKNADGAVMTRTWFNPKGPEVLDLFAVAVNEVIVGSKDATTALSEAAQTANDEVLADAESPAAAETAFDEADPLASYSDAGIDWQQAAGEEIILGGLEHPWIEALTPLLPQFTELTGIKVTPQIASETEYVTKMPVTLGGGSATPNIFMVWAMGQAVAAKWLEPLDMYYADPKLTDLAWYDEADIFNSARQFPVWPTDKRRYTATITAEAQTLFLRQDLMEEKGLGAPKTFDDLLALAEALKTDEMAGIAMRAKPTGDAVAWPAAGFVFSYGGQIIDENGKAVFDSPEAVAAIEMYAKLLGENGPQGVGTYHWYEALNDFMQGKVAISGDSSNFAADIENPEKSTVAGKTLYGAFPQQGSLPSKPNLWHWMIGMNAASEHKTAAWLFMQWATSKPTSIQLGRNGAAPARISTWEDADFKARFGEQAAEAALANLKNADGAVMTRTWFNPKGPEVLDLFAVAVNEVIVGSKDATTALSEAAQTANDEVLSQ